MTAPTADSLIAASPLPRTEARRLLEHATGQRREWLLAHAERFEIIVANPPYIADADPHLTEGDLRFEPRSALASGSDGLDALREIASGALAHLVTSGRLIVEHGWDQGAAVRTLFLRAGLQDVHTQPDLAGHERLTFGRAP